MKRKKEPILPSELKAVVELIRRNLEEGSEAVANGEYTERHRLFFREKVLELFGIKEVEENPTRPGRPRKNDKVVRVVIGYAERIGVEDQVDNLVGCLSQAGVLAVHAGNVLKFDLLPPATTDRKYRRLWAHDVAEVMREKGFQATVEDEITSADIERILKMPVRRLYAESGETDPKWKYTDESSSTEDGDE